MLMNKVLQKVDEFSPKYSWWLSDKLGLKYQVYKSTLTPLEGIDPQRFSHNDLAQQRITYGKSGEPQSSDSGPLAANPIPERTPIPR